LSAEVIVSSVDDGGKVITVWHISRHERDIELALASLPLETHNTKTQTSTRSRNSEQPKRASSKNQSKADPNTHILGGMPFEV